MRWMNARLASEDENGKKVIDVTIYYRFIGAVGQLMA